MTSIEIENSYVDSRKIFNYNFNKSFIILSAFTINSSGIIIIHIEKSSNESFVNLKSTINFILMTTLSSVLSILFLYLFYIISHDCMCSWKQIVEKIVLSHFEGLSCRLVSYMELQLEKK